MHVIDGKKFNAQFPQTKNEECSETSSSCDGENVVEVHGNIKGLKDEALKMHLEKARRSGGGKIEEINLVAKPPRVTFCDVEGESRIINSCVQTLHSPEELKAESGSTSCSVNSIFNPSEGEK